MSGRTPPATPIRAVVPYLDTIYDQCSKSILHTMGIYASFFFPSSISAKPEGPEEFHPSSGHHMSKVYSSASESESPWVSLANNDPSSAPI